MKRIAWSVLLVLVVSLVAACGDDDDSNADAGDGAGLAVAATTTIIADLARNVAGERASVTAIVPAGADPHDFEPTPADIEQIADADLILELGLGYDIWTGELIDQSGTDGAIVEVTTGIETIVGGEDDSNVDPHVWFDAARVKVMVTNIRDALIEVEPDGRAAYETNAGAYLAELNELDGWIREQVATIPEADRKLVTSHDAFGYYVAAYGFEYVGTVIPSLDTQARASAQQIEALLELIAAEQVRAVFTETTVNPDLTEQIAREAGVEVVTTLFSDSLTDDGSDTDTYIGMMRHNTTAIVEALT